MMRGAANLSRLPPPRRSALTGLTVVALLVMSTVALLTACGGEAPPGNPGSGGEDVTRVNVEAPNQRPDGLNEPQTRARAVLAARLMSLAETLTLVNDEAVQWPDASLGCPREGMSYAQLMTPEHRMTFRHNQDTCERATSLLDGSG